MNSQIKKYFKNHIGIIAFLLFVILSFVCVYILSITNPTIQVTAISDFGIYDETKWIFVVMCTAASLGIFILFKKIFIELVLVKNILLSMFSYILCLSFIGISLLPYTYFETLHTVLALGLFGGFGIFLLLLAIIKKFKGRYIIFTGVTGIIELVFMIVIFPILTNYPSGWLISEIILLAMMGLWIVISEMFLRKRGFLKL
jgi:hypothetical protein